MNLADFHFAEPGWLWLAATAPVGLAWLHLRAARARRQQLAHLATPQSGNGWEFFAINCHNVNSGSR